jgi:hypothetical protein
MHHTSQAIADGTGLTRSGNQKQPVVYRSASAKLPDAGSFAASPEQLNPSPTHRDTTQNAPACSICTKDVFKDIDGFLYLMSVLSTIQDRPTELAVDEPETQVLQETINAHDGCS